MSTLPDSDRQVIIRKLADEARQEFIDQLDDFAPSIRLADEVKWESPIEEVFAIAWQAHRLVSAFCAVASTVQILVWPQAVPQFTVSANGKAYRLDFAFPNERIAVECDGHAFHEKTPEQVELRNERDADLHSAGWRVFHFSGRQLVRKPSACTQRVSDAMIDVWADRCRKQEHGDA